MATDTRQRIVSATAALFATNGFAGTGLKRVAADSGAPFGSIYHFFPGGKEDLAAAALRAAGAGYAEVVGAVLELGGDDLAGAITGAFVGAGDRLVATDFADACPIATVALEVASSNEALRLVTAEIFEGWLAWLDGWFVGHGVPDAEARDLSMLLLAALEGGFVLCRAAKDATPMAGLGRAVAAQAVAAVEAG